MTIMTKVKNKLQNIIKNKNIKKHKLEMQKLYKNGDITIISNNCLAGVIYNILNLKFSSPTINQWMKMSDFLQFISNLKYYLKCDLVEAKDEEEKYGFPVGKLVSNDPNDIYTLTIIKLLRKLKLNGRKESRELYGIKYM